ncbi:sigma 54-interacting transcriptional regulator [Planctomicrobium sp. SH664]|uniref:sigma 54-interacting transcriptional regulator n=1 Tax=Planctomicrobium sp. SH664 TaxID=3448125 RepID=UPI003F5B2337
MTPNEVTRVDSQYLPTNLVLQRGDARLEVIDLATTARVTIGRASANDVIVPDAKCSRNHCELHLIEGVWHLRDLDSRNGVTLNGERVEPGDHPLVLGDTIGIGGHTLELSGPTTIDILDNPSATSTLGHVDEGYAIIERKSGTQYDGPSGLQRTQRQQDGATALFRIARSMATTSTETQLCQTVLEALCVRTAATLGGIFLVPHGVTEPNVNTLEVGAVHGNKSLEDFSTFLTRVAIDDRDAILAHDISQHESLAAHESLQELRAECAICAPIRHANRVLGVIHLYGLTPNATMTQADLEFVLAVGDQMGDQLQAMRERAELEEGLDRVRRHVSDLQVQLQAETELVGNSRNLEEVRRAIARVAPTDALVLIRGESGVGKELVARAVHFNSQRREGPFVCVNCAALTASLLESELFGHEKGAFTGASARRAGKFEQAHGGTIFLDEIGEMSPEVQAKFLRVLEGQPFERVGGGEPISVDVRVVTATNRNLEEAVRERQFRRDLFFRLQVIEIVVPPLREHPEDVPAIAEHFVQRFAEQAHRKVRGFNAAALQKLQRHDWPGNVRELRNVVERAVILADGDILGPEDVVLTKLNLEQEHAPPVAAAPAAAEPQNMMGETSIDPLLDLWGSLVQQNISLDDIDRLYIEAVLKVTEWNKSKASRILQIERTTLDRRLKKYGLGRPNGEDDTDDETSSL